MELKRHHRRISVAALGSCALLVIVSLLTGATASGATTLSMVSADLVIGSINVSWEGEVALDAETVLDGWELVGSEEPPPFADGLAHLDSFEALDHVAFLLVTIFVYNTGGCVITVHGPITANYAGSNEYHAAFDKLELGGILYSQECNSGSFDSLVLSEVATNGVLITYRIEHA